MNHKFSKFKKIHNKNKMLYKILIYFCTKDITENGIINEFNFHQFK